MDGRPNILWYCTDQQRFDTIGALGNPYVQTSTLDRLVHEGVAFERAYCQAPICTPSRSSFLTGMYPSRLHNTRNGNESFPDFPPLITKLIADSGYECGMIGKFHIQASGRRTEPRVDDGYTYWKFSHAPRDDWAEGHDYDDWVKAQGGDLDALRLSDDHVPPELHQTKWASDMAIDFIRRGRDCPWLLSINIYDPHPPFIPPKAYADRFDPGQMPGPYFRESDLAQQAKLKDVDFQGDVKSPEERNAKAVQAMYYAMIAQIDDQFARLLDLLDETGQRENTVIILTTDHGEALGDHGLLQKGCRFYEGLGCDTGYPKEACDVIYKALEERHGIRFDVVADSEVVAGRPTPFLVYNCMDQTNVYPVEAVVKADDIELGLHTGRNAGAWTVGLYATGVHDYERLQQADPDFLIPSAKYLPELIFTQIQPRLLRGESPGQGLAFDPTDADVRLGRGMRTDLARGRIGSRTDP